MGGLGREVTGGTVGRVGAVTSITGLGCVSGCMLMLIVSRAQLVMGVVEFDKTFPH